MKAQTKAVVASIVVIALALSAVSGVTYSWFSDSETSEIDVSTAKIDIKGEYAGDSPVVTSSSGAAVTDTTAKYSSDKKNIEISNFIDQRKITADYELTNMSTINVLYRMYVVVEGVTDEVAGKLVSIKSSSTEIELVPLVFKDGRACAVDTDPSKKIILDAPATETKYAFALTIDSKDVSVQGISDFKVKIINEVYQSDYEYSSDQSIESGEAQLPTSIVTEDVTFSGTTSAAEGVKASDAEVTFSANTLNKITDNGNKKVTLKTETLASTGSIAKIALELVGSSVTDFGTEKVNVSLSIPGNYTGLKVKYNGDGAQPTDVNCVYDSAKNVTNVTFSTTHFSEFEVVADENSTAEVYDMASFRNAVNAGVGTINVVKDIDLNGVTDVAEDRIYITSKTTLNLGAKIIFPDNAGNNTTNFAVLFIRADTTINATEDGGIDTGKNGAYCINVLNEAVLTINGGTYYGGGTAVQVQKGTAYINGGNFSVEPFSDAKYGFNFVLNCVDNAYKDGSAKIIVKGGVFSNYDPSQSRSENPVANFLDADLITVKNGDMYSVVAFPEGKNVFDGENYYATMTDALNGIHKTGKHTLWCKPGADLGKMSHGHVCSDLTVYGNGAHVLGDFEIDMYKIDGCAGIVSDTTLTVYSLNNMAVWGQRHTAYTINISLYDCKDMNEVLIRESEGPVNVSIYDCSFDGDIANHDTALYTNAVGTIHVENTTFNNYALGVNQNNKSGGLQTIDLINCTFNDCGLASYVEAYRQFASAVRIVASVEHSVTQLTTNNCEFIYTGDNKPANDVNILFGDDREGKEVLGEVYHNKEPVEQLKPTAKA